MGDADPRIRLITRDSIPGMLVVKTLLPAQGQVIQVTGRRITAALRRKRPAPSAAAPPPQGLRTTVSTFSFTSPSRPVKRARVASPPKAAAGGSVQPVTPPKAPPPRVPPVLPVVSLPSTSAATPSSRAPPALPSTSPRASSSAAAPGPSSASSSARSPPAPKITAVPRAPPPASENPQQLQEASDAAFDAAARERWRRPGHSGAPEPPMLIFMGEAGNGSIYLGGLPTDRAWLDSHNIGLCLSAMDKTASDCREASVRAKSASQFNVPVGHQGALRDRQLKLVLPIFLATLYSGYSVLIHCIWPGFTEPPSWQGCCLPGSGVAPSMQHMPDWKDCVPASSTGEVAPTSCSGRVAKSPSLHHPCPGTRCPSSPRPKPEHNGTLSAAVGARRTPPIEEMFIVLGVSRRLWSTIVSFVSPASLQGCVARQHLY